MEEDMWASGLHLQLAHQLLLQQNFVSWLKQKMYIPFSQVTPTQVVLYHASVINSMTSLYFCKIISPRPNLRLYLRLRDVPRLL